MTDQRVRGHRRAGLKIRPTVRYERKLVVLICFVLIALCLPAQAAEWSEPAEVLWQFQPVVTYRAKLDAGHLVVEARHQPGWHTYAMDNKLRATEKLAGKKSLGIDGPTRITVSDGLEVSGTWRQSPPNDYSKPELRWFTWGFEESAFFAAPVKTEGAGPAQITIRGQACDEKSCRNIELGLSVPLGNEAKQTGDAIDLNEMVEVRRQAATEAK